MMKKSILLVCSMSLLVLALAGCAAGNANTLGQTESPAVTFTPQTATMAPVTTAAPMDTMAPGNSQSMNGTGGMTQGDTNGMNGTGTTNGAGAASAASAMTPADAGRLAERIAEAVERISEVDDAEVIVRDERALIAVEFDDQYSAGLDERMKQPTTETAQKEDEKITEVEITDDSTLYGQVKSLAERIGKATGFDELADDIGDLWDRVTGQ